MTAKQRPSPGKRRVGGHAPIRADRDSDCSSAESSCELEGHGGAVSWDGGVGGGVEVRRARPGDSKARSGGRTGPWNPSRQTQTM